MRALKIYCVSFLAISVAVSIGVSPAYTKDQSKNIDSLIENASRGKETGLPLPRFVSLKRGETNMRVGPSFEHRVSYKYLKPRVPVEVIEEFDVWRKIRDVDGIEGWVHKIMLSANRFAIIAPEERGQYFPVLNNPLETAAAVAKLEGGVHTTIRNCEDNWCRIQGTQYSGWIKADSLWGVYDGETVKR